MNILVKGVVALSLMTLIQHAVGQESAQALQLKNVMENDTHSIVGEIALTYYGNATCTTAMLGQTIISGGNPLSFITNTTILINPSSVYVAAVGLGTAAVASVAVSMVDTNDNGVFKETGDVTPCFAVACNDNTQQCTNNSSISLITEESIP